FKLENISEYKAFCALEYCNVHGLWENCIEI
ncbi:MAG: desulfoferrodoxin, partial [Methanosarcinales archaeon]|nr:desulfoferrodoxin [Methanosarcinales archaeon]